MVISFCWGPDWKSMSTPYLLRPASITSCVLVDPNVPILGTTTNMMSDKGRLLAFVAGMESPKHVFLRNRGKGVSARKAPVAAPTPVIYIGRAIAQNRRRLALTFVSVRTTQSPVVLASNR